MAQSAPALADSGRVSADTLPATVAPSGTMLSRGTHANGPITQSAPMLLSRPMNVNGLDDRVRPDRHAGLDVRVRPA